MSSISGDELEQCYGALRPSSVFDCFDSSVVPFEARCLCLGIVVANFLIRAPIRIAFIINRGWFA